MASRDLFYTVDTSGNRLPSLTITGAGTYYSSSFHGAGREGHSIHVATPSGSTLAGTLTLWRSNDPSALSTDANDDKWVQDSGFAAGTIVSGANKLMDETDVTHATQYRLKFVYTSGSGTLSAYLHDGRR